MQLEELKGKIKTSQFGNHYVFIGPEKWLMRHYIQELSQKTGYKVKYLDSVADIEKNKNNGALIKRHYIYIVIDDKDFLDSEIKKNSLKLGRIQGNNIAILIYSDMRKIREDNETLTVVKFDNVTLPIARRFTKRRINMKDSYIDFFNKNICELNLDRICTELEKIVQISKIYNIDEEKAFEKCFNEGLFHIPEKVEIFDFIDDLLKKDWPKVVNQMRIFKNQKENPLGFVSLLYNHLKGIYLVKLAERAQKKASTDNTGLEKYQIASAISHKDKFSLGELNRLMRLCRWIDRAVKDGDVNMDLIMDLVISQFDK